jgi:hypothetical protein
MSAALSSRAFGDCLLELWNLLVTALVTASGKREREPCSGIPTAEDVVLILRGMSPSLSVHFPVTDLFPLSCALVAFPLGIPSD